MALLRTSFLLAFLSTWLGGQDPIAIPWQVREIKDLRGPSTVMLMHDRVGWICTGLNTLLKTLDGGVSWTILKTNLSQSGTDVVGLWFIDNNHGWATGAVQQQPTIWETRDGGSSWIATYVEPRAFEGSNGGILDIRFVDGARGWAVGYNGLKAIIITTTDGGKHWTTQYSGSEITWQFNSVRFVDSSNGWALAPNAILQTRDGGASWFLRYFDGGALLNDIDVVGPTNVWAAGARGHLFHTQDGIGWSEVPLPASLSDSFVERVRFISKDVGWAWGAKGEIVMTTDGGKSWNREQPPLNLASDPELLTSAGATNGSRLFITASPGQLLVRSIQ